MQIMYPQHYDSPDYLGQISKLVDLVDRVGASGKKAPNTFASDRWKDLVAREGSVESAANSDEGKYLLFSLNREAAGSPNQRGNFFANLGGDLGLDNSYMTQDQFAAAHKIDKDVLGKVLTTYGGYTSDKQRMSPHDQMAALTIVSSLKNPVAQGAASKFQVATGDMQPENIDLTLQPAKTVNNLNTGMQLSPAAQAPAQPGFMGAPGATLTGGAAPAAQQAPATMVGVPAAFGGATGAMPSAQPGFSQPVIVNATSQTLTTPPPAGGPVEQAMLGNPNYKQTPKPTVTESSDQIRATGLGSGPKVNGYGLVTGNMPEDKGMPYHSDAYINMVASAYPAATRRLMSKLNMDKGHYPDYALQQIANVGHLTDPKQKKVVGQLLADYFNKTPELTGGQQQLTPETAIDLFLSARDGEAQMLVKRDPNADSTIRLAHEGPAKGSTQTENGLLTRVNFTPEQAPAAEVVNQAQPAMSMPNNSTYTTISADNATLAKATELQANINSVIQYNAAHPESPMPVPQMPAEYAAALNNVQTHKGWAGLPPDTVVQDSYGREVRFGDLMRADPNRAKQIEQYAMANRGINATPGDIAGNATMQAYNTTLNPMLAETLKQQAMSNATQSRIVKDSNAQDTLAQNAEKLQVQQQIAQMRAQSKEEQEAANRASRERIAALRTQGSKAGAGRATDNMARMLYNSMQNAARVHLEASKQTAQALGDSRVPKSMRDELKVREDMAMQAYEDAVAAYKAYSGTDEGEKKPAQPSAAPAKPGSNPVDTLLNAAKGKAPAAGGVTDKGKSVADKFLGK